MLHLITLISSIVPGCAALVAEHAAIYLNLPDQVDEQSLVFVIQVGQIIGEVTEIVADADLDMIAHMPV